MVQQFRRFQFTQVSLVLISFSITCFAGCGAGTTTPKSTPSVVAPKAPKGKLVTKKEAEEFGRQLEKVVLKGTQVEFEKLIKMEGIAENSMRGLDVPADFKKGLIKGIKQGSVNLFSQLQQAAQGGGNYEFLRVREKDGRYTALFRLAQPDMGGLNYHEHSLVNNSGIISSDDIYIFISAENMSTSMRRMIIPVVAQQNKGILARLSKTENTYLKNMTKVSQISKSLREQNGKEALRVYNTLPQEMRDSKVFLIFRIQAASLLEGEDNKYLAAISDFRRLFPEDSCVDFLSLDYYALRKETDNLLVSLDRVEKSVGGDPFLGLMKASFLVEAKRLPEAEKTIKKALKEDDSITDLHWVLIGIYQKNKQYPELLNAMLTLDKVEKMKWDDLTKVEGYEGFVKSPQHQQWLQHLKDKKK